MHRLISLPSTDVCVKQGLKSKLYVARGNTGPQWSGCRFRCGVLVWIYFLTSYSSLCSLIEYQEIVICIYILDYYRRVNILIQQCRSRRGRDHMEVGLTTTCAISAYHL